MGFQPAVFTINTNFVLPDDGNHYTILVDASLGDILIDLPLITDELKGRHFVVKKIDGTTNLVTLQPAVSNYIDSEANLTINTTNESVTFTNDGDTDWLIF